MLFRCMEDELTLLGSQGDGSKKKFSCTIYVHEVSFLYKPARRGNSEVLVGVGRGGAWEILLQGFP